MTLVFTVVFGKLAGLSTDGLPPVLFYLCGQLGWNYFAQTFSSNSATFVANAALFSKVYFPRLIVPLAALVSNLFAFAIQFATFVCFFIYFKYVRGAGGFGMDWPVVLLPLLVLQTARPQPGRRPGDVGADREVSRPDARERAADSGLDVRDAGDLSVVDVPAGVAMGRRRSTR